MYQRPQHLLSRASRQWRIWFIEEPVYGNESRLELTAISERLTVVVPHIKHGTSPGDAIRQQREAIDQLIARHTIRHFIAWYYTPMALTFSAHLTPQLTIYDCMDELSAFLGAPPSLLEQENALLERADLVFTGGLSLFKANRPDTPACSRFPAVSIITILNQRDTRCRSRLTYRELRGPHRFCGVIDERMDLGLVAALARKQVDWQFIFLGPVVKIDPNSLPTGDNLHYLGMKSYAELPAYFSHWDVAMMPFAINEATRFISPTKTPEYLAAGLPVVSTPIQDVISTYGGWAPVLIGDSPQAFEQAINLAFTHQNLPDDWMAVDEYLLANSWDTTWKAMNRLVQTRIAPVFQ